MDSHSPLLLKTRRLEPGPAVPAQLPCERVGTLHHRPAWRRIRLVESDRFGNDCPRQEKHMVGQFHKPVSVTCRHRFETCRSLATTTARHNSDQRQSVEALAKCRGHRPRRLVSLCSKPRIDRIHTGSLVMRDLNSYPDSTTATQKPRIQIGHGAGPGQSHVVPGYWSNDCMRTIFVKGGQWFGLESTKERGDGDGLGV